MKGSEGLSPAFPKGLVQRGPGAPLVHTGPPAARGLLLAVAGSLGEEREGLAAGSLGWVSRGYREIWTAATWAGGKRCPSSRGLARTLPAPGADLQDCSVPTGRTVSLLRCLGPTVGPVLMKQTDKGLHGDKHCSVEQQETRVENPSSDSTKVTESSCSWNPCFGGSCHGFPKRSAAKASTCLVLFSGQLRFSVK